MRPGLTPYPTRIALLASVLALSLVAPPLVHLHGLPSPNANSELPLLASNGHADIVHPLCPACAAGRSPAATLPAFLVVGAFERVAFAGPDSATTHESYLSRAGRARGPPTSSAL